MPALDENLGNLDIILAALRKDHLGKEEFTKSFKTVVDFVLKIQQRQQEAIAELQKTYNQLQTKLEQAINLTLTDLKKQVNEVFVGKRLDEMTGEQRNNMGEIRKMIIDTINRKLGEVDFRMSKLKDGERGMEGMIGPRGPQGSPGIIDDKTLEELRGEIKKTRRILAGPSADAVLSYDASIQSDGSRTAFDVPRHRKALLVVTTQALFFYRPTVDFTTANLTLTFTGAVEPPANGQTVLFLYVK